MLLISQTLLWVIVLALCVLLLGTTRALALLKWRLEELEATTPRRLGRNGLKLGTKAPDFTLPSTQGGGLGLASCNGRGVLLVFLQLACQPCRRIVPRLNRLQAKDDIQVLGVCTGDLEEIRKWVGQVSAELPVVVQSDHDLSRRYEVFATPFAFLIDRKGVIISKGLISKPQHIRFVLDKEDGLEGTSSERGQQEALK